MSGDDLAGRIALVTGGASGIGLAICRELSDRGAKVALSDLDAAAASAAARDLPNAVPVHLDVTDRDSVERGIDTAESELGPLDSLICNAGIERARPFVETTPEIWQALISVNFVGVLNCCHLVVPRMIERGRGRVVFTASEAGKVGSSGEAVYSGTKGAVIAFGKSLARETVRHGITVNSVCPGPVETPLLAGVAAESERNQRLVERLAASIPMRRLGRPEDVSGVVAFLLSDAAAYMTGQALSVSGGLVMS
ncbi:MAG: SDR family NAD(P)-dependent oxidoreductase [Candidatus Dormibacteria bacterium]